MSIFRALRSVLGQASVAGKATPKRTFLVRLARNNAANVMPIMAMSLFPLAGLVGGAFDMSRLYLVKTRLQQACDAGALAGRRVMGAGQWSANGNAANTAALQFFDGNFANDAYGTSNRTRAFSESAGRVTGTASVQVPMTLMRIFGQRTRTLTVDCDAEMRLPNTDIMFVLDTTGSMAETISGDDATKMETLRFAVKCFYETVARLNTDADCTPGTPGPTGGTGSQVQIRFGFVPYATNVNVGKLLPAEHFADEWGYQSRVANYTTQVYGPDQVIGSETVTWVTYSQSIDRSDCGRWGLNQQFTNENTGTVYTPNPTGNPTYTGTNPIVRRTYSNDNDEGDDWSWSGAPDTVGPYRSCRRRVATVNVQRPLRYGFTTWTYRSEPIDVSAYVADRSALFATGTTGTVATSGTYNMRELATMSGTEGITTATLNWDGCIEERATVRETDYSPIPEGALDLNIDDAPASGTTGSFWGPTLPDAVFLRGRYWDGGDNRVEGTRIYNSVANTTTNYIDGDFIDNNSWNGTYQGYFCPTEARKMQPWSGSTGATAFQNYVDSLNTNGNTYHDIGLIWGARLLSPTGIFASENALTPQGGEIERHLIFMTDGQTCTGRDNYQAYGIAWWDRRQTPVGTGPTDGCDNEWSDGGTLSQQVNARFSALCEAVQNQNITLWVVYFGSTDQDTIDRMTACATPGRFFYANNAAGLITSFRTIADQISQLRLTR